MGEYCEKQLTMFTVQLKNGEMIEVPIEQLEEFLEKKSYLYKEPVQANGKA